LTFPKPVPAQVIRYSYLWHKDAALGAEEGNKDRPCAIVMMVQNEDGEDVVTVLPITHAPPYDSADALEIPADTKRRLGLDDARSWVVVAESNRFRWPGPDLRMARPGEAESILYGSLSGAFFEKVRLAFLAKIRAARANIVTRTE
jgi:hypothetical protein